MDANVNIGLNINGDGAINTVGSLKAQLRQAQAEVALLSDQFGATSVEVQNAARKAADLADRIGDAKRITEAYNPDAKFNALQRALGGVLNGFQAYQGALGLIGADSKEVERMLLKVQSAMALTSGINGVLEAKDDFINLGVQVKNVFAGMTSASKAFAVTGIGVVLTAVGLLIANWDTLFGKQKQYKAETDKTAQSLAKESTEFIGLTSALKHTNAGSKERADLIKKINDQYGTTIKNLKDEKKFQEQVNTVVKDYLLYQRAKFAAAKNSEQINKTLEKQLALENKIATEELNLNRLRTQGALGGQSIENQKGYNDEIEKSEKKINGYRSAIKSLDGTLEMLGYSQLQNIELGDKFTKGTEKSTTVDNDKADALKRIAEAQKEYSNTFLSDQQVEINAVNDKYKKLIDDATKYGQDTSVLEDARLNALNDVNVKYLLIEEEKLNKREKLYKDALDKAKQYEIEASNSYLDEIELLSEQNFQAGLTEQQREEQAVNDKYFRLLTMAGDNKEQLKIIEEAKGRELKEITDKYVKKDEETQRESLASKLQMASEAIGVLGSLFEGATAKNEREARKQFKINKAFSLSSAVVNTALAVTKSLPNPIAVALAAATGAIQIAKIASTQFGGWTPPDVPAPPPGPTDNSTQENAFTPSTFISLGKAQTGASANYGSTKVYVLESDITSVQNKVGVIESRSYLGG